MNLSDMLEQLPKQCDTGAKKNSNGNTQYWRGYKLHLDVADGQIPISAVLTSASVHDSQVAIPLATMTTQRVTYCYELMDAAYDAHHIREQSRSWGTCRSSIPISTRANNSRCRRLARGNSPLPSNSVIENAPWWNASTRA